jgi:sec-independent protein translocase protein TatA
MIAFGIPSGPELWIILAIFVLLFGNRIPKLARAMGSSITEFKRGTKEGEREIKEIKKELKDAK